MIYKLDKRINLHPVCIYVYMYICIYVYMRILKVPYKNILNSYYPKRVIGNQNYSMKK